MKTPRYKKKLTKTKKNKNVSSRKYSEPAIVYNFLQMLNTVKLYHWKTHNYAQHKATDKLYSELNDNIDLFVEIMLGKNGDRVNLTNTKSLPLFDYNNLSSFEKEINKYKDYLIGMSSDSNLDLKNNTDLLNVRDTMLGVFNQFTYLLTFQ